VQGTDTTSDELFMARVLADPSAYIAYSHESGLAYTEVAQEFLTQNARAESGCPAMGVSLSMNGEKINLYDAFWRYYSGIYITNYEAGEPFMLTVPRFDD